MALATVNLTFEDDLIKQIDYFASNQSLTRTDLIYNSVKMYINRKQKLLELYAYGEQVAAEKALQKIIAMGPGWLFVRWAPKAHWHCCAATTAVLPRSACRE